MKIDRSEFPPLSAEHFVAEYLVTEQSLADLLDIIRTVPPEAWPPALRAQPFVARQLALNKPKKPRA